MLNKLLVWDMHISISPLSAPASLLPLHLSAYKRYYQL